MAKLMPKAGVQGGCVPVSLAYLTGHKMAAILKLRALCAKQMGRRCRAGTPIEIMRRMMEKLGVWHDVSASAYTVHGFRLRFPFSTLLVVAHAVNARGVRIAHAFVLDESAVRCPASQASWWLEHGSVYEAYRLIETLPAIGADGGKISYRIDLTPRD